MRYNRFDNKRILVWGYGREGKSTEDFLNRVCKPAVVDIFEGKIDEIKQDDYDVIFKSPGIIMEEDNEKFTSQTELFLEEYRDQVIGITGTKGKSTTSTMLYTVLSRCSDRPVLLLGNIGQPCLDYFDSMTEDTIVVYEMSCHQLCHTGVSPHVGVFLNLFEEHLDYYKTMDRYFTAKSHVATYQGEADYFYHGDNVPHIDSKAKEVIITPDSLGEYKLSIEGLHNRYNAEFVFRIATEVYGLNSDDVLAAIEDFKGLSHRLELVGEVNGVRFYDDSISTIPEASISAMNSIDGARTLLIGGMDRGIDYTKLIEFMKAHAEFIYICMYASGKRIYESGGFESCDNVIYVEELKEAFEKARECTEAGKAVILSPAAASYGYFKNFEERGDVFKSYVLQEGE